MFVSAFSILDTKYTMKQPVTTVTIIFYSKNLFLTAIPYVLESVSHLLQRGVPKDLVDFDNYLDDQSQDWSNQGIEKLIASINASIST